LIVGSQVKNSTVLQFAVQPSEKLGGHEAVDAVSGLWPWIGAQHVDPLEYVIRQQRHQLPALDPEQSYIVQFAPLHFSLHSSHAPEHHIGAYQQAVGEAFGHGQKIAAAAAAQIKLNGAVAVAELQLSILAREYLNPSALIRGRRHG
jgi:hypothetical protein